MSHRQSLSLFIYPLQKVSFLVLLALWFDCKRPYLIQIIFLFFAFCLLAIKTEGQLCGCLYALRHIKKRYFPFCIWFSLLMPIICAICGTFAIRNHWHYRIVVSGSVIVIVVMVVRVVYVCRPIKRGAPYIVKGILMFVNAVIRCEHL